MNRREMLFGSAAIAAAVASSGKAFAETMDMSHMHHHHHPSARNQALLDAATDCIQRGEICMAHCLRLMATGDTETAECAISVNQMLAVCEALQKLSAAESKYLASQAKVALELCEACAKECKKHADKHEECKACGESCEACAKECKKLVG
jgi:Cys-rich four helix bundle protein (predicted Tat secretion target)